MCVLISFFVVITVNMSMLLKAFDKEFWLNTRLPPLATKASWEQLCKLMQITSIKPIFFIVFYLALIVTYLTIDFHFFFRIIVFNDSAVTIAFTGRAYEKSFHYFVTNCISLACVGITSNSIFLLIKN